MPQDHTTAPPPLDFQVDDVWLCRDGVTLVTITEYLTESAYSYPITGIVQGEEEDDLWTKDGRYDLENKDNDLDLVKLISRNGSPINHTN